MGLAEDLIVDASARNPLERVCTTMRKRDVHWVLRLARIQDESYFRSKYPAVADECDYLQSLDLEARIRVDQLAFFGSDVQ